MKTELLAISMVMAAGLISLLSIGFFFKLLEKSHRAVMLLVALAAGTLLGDAFFHLLPHAAEEAGGFTFAMAMYATIGFLAFFLLEAFLNHSHSHGEHLGEHDHGHSKNRAFGINNLVSDTIHNFVDGIVIGAAFLADIKLGFATTLAVLLHEIPQEIGDFAVLIRSGMSRKKAFLLNGLVSLTSVLGVVLILYLPLDPEIVEAFALPFVAGAFLYIAASDLIPELHHHNHGREMLPMAGGLFLGIAIMIGLQVGEEGIFSLFGG